MIYTNYYLDDLLSLCSPATNTCHTKVKRTGTCPSTSTSTKKSCQTKSQETHPISIDVYETEKEYYLNADLPGVPKECISVTTEERTVQLEAQLSSKPDASPTMQEGSCSSTAASSDACQSMPEYHIQERPYSANQKIRLARNIVFPEDADLDRISAQYELGVLTLKIEKKQKAEKKVIPLA